MYYLVIACFICSIKVALITLLAIYYIKIHSVKILLDIFCVKNTISLAKVQLFQR